MTDTQIFALAIIDKWLDGEKPGVANGRWLGYDTTGTVQLRVGDVVFLETTGDTMIEALGYLANALIEQCERVISKREELSK